MGTEIERRFLVKEEFDPAPLAFQTINIVQSYLPNTGGWTIRARKEAWWTQGCEGDEITYTLTLKKFVSNATNIEIETEITEREYEDLIVQTGEKLSKTRYVIINENEVLPHTKWEVDVYINAPADFKTIAEVELGSEDDFLTLPDWVDREVTGDRSFSNAALAERLTQ